MKFESCYFDKKMVTDAKEALKASVAKRMSADNSGDSVAFLDWCLHETEEYNTLVIASYAFQHLSDDEISSIEDFDVRYAEEKISKEMKYCAFKCPETEHCFKAMYKDILLFKAKMLQNEADNIKL